ncbi:HD-GYP domain-containing protein [Solirubrobacter taibaiensis]|nr:HD-GYP domain-containing protein [Solirubrobacter taibaiensis]
MGLDPDLAAQARILDELRLRRGGLAQREALVERAFGGVFAVVALGLAFAGGWDGISVLAALGATLAFVVAARVEFDISGGFTAPTQLAFVPLLFVAPATHVPLLVGLAWTCARMPDLLSGKSSLARLWVTFGNGWYSLGPALVLILAGAHDAGDAGPWVLLAALAAQFVVDVFTSALREAALRGPSLLAQISELREVVAIDAALVPIGLLVGLAAAEYPWAPVALLPLLGVLAVFARERRERVRSLAELSNAYRGTAYVLGDVVEADDAYTGEHCRGVVQLAMEVGERLGLSPDGLRNLEFGALLHDVGKIAIPNEIINKPGKLDPDEWQIIKTHTTEGQAMLDRVGGFMSDVGRIVRSHHERWDGGGYPDGLAGEAIPIEARIVAACDSWNAMTTDRSYRKALPFELAQQELAACSGSQFDPRVIEVMLAIVTPEADGPAAPVRLDVTTV